MRRQGWGIDGQINTPPSWADKALDHSTEVGGAGAAVPGRSFWQSGCLGLTAGGLRLQGQGAWHHLPLLAEAERCTIVLVDTVGGSGISGTSCAAILRKEGCLFTEVINASWNQRLLEPQPESPINLWL